MKNKKKGFTLVELLVVIAIIAILAAIIAPNAFKAIEKSKVATAESDYKAIKTAALSYYADTGAWPADGAGDKGFVTKPEGVDKPTGIQVTKTVENAWNGPYLEKWPTKNPWGGKYYFIVGNDKTTDLGLNSDTKMLKLDNMNSNAIDRLEADLDGDSTYDGAAKGIVRSKGTTVYLIISEQ